MKIHNQTGHDFNELMAIILPKRRCNKKIKNKNVISRCPNEAECGSIFCEKHAAADEKESIEAEYIIINNKEYLYHSLSNRVFSISNKPEHIGYLEENGVITPC